MARESHAVGTWGKINKKEIANGKWRARTYFRDADGATRQVEAWGETGPKSERNLKLKLTDRASMTDNEVTERMRVSQLIEIWVSEMRMAGDPLPQTIDEYERLAKATILPALGQLMIREVSVSRVTAFINHIAKVRNQPSLARNTHLALRQILQVAVRHDAILSNPAANAKRPKRIKKDIRALGEDELRTVRRAVRSYRTGPGVKGPKPTSFIPDAVDVMLATGVRIGELLAIRWDDVDLEADRPTVTISGTLIQRKGEPLYRQPFTKSDAGFRTIILPRFAVDVLLKRQVENPWDNHCNAVFPSAVGSWYFPNNFNRTWRDIRRDNNLDWVVPHTFRKTVATMIERELDVHAASKQLGHSSEKVTLEHYIEKSANIAPDNTFALDKLGPNPSTALSDQEIAAATAGWD